MGAWIETAFGELERYINLSHPMWVRGLKHIDPQKAAEIQAVAPHVGAWIETLVSLDALLHSLSHPMWVRGLKQSNRHYIPMNF